MDKINGVLNETTKFVADSAMAHFEPMTELETKTTDAVGKLVEAADRLGYPENPPTVELKVSKLMEIIERYPDAKFLAFWIGDNHKSPVVIEAAGEEKKPGQYTILMPGIRFKDLSKDDTTEKEDEDE